MGMFLCSARIISSRYQSIVDVRGGFALEEDTIRNHWNLDDAAVGESPFQISKSLAIVVPHLPLNIMRLIAMSSKSRAK
jgi:hypothetical protein